MGKCNCGDIRNLAPKLFVSTIKKIDPTISLEPQHILNIDESGFAINVQSRSFGQSCQQAHLLIGSECRTMITSLFVPAQQISSPSPCPYRGFSSGDEFPDSFISKSENGWMNQELFKQYREYVFIPAW